MDNNTILRKIRYTFNYSDQQMIDIFAFAESKVNRELVSNWLKKEDDPEFKELEDLHLASFLNGIIILNRGKKDGEVPKAETRLSNNLIFRKLKIALNLKDEDILAILLKADFQLSKHELSAFFRKPGQKQYRECKDQMLRNFILGLQMRYREGK